MAEKPVYMRRCPVCGKGFDVNHTDGCSKMQILGNGGKSHPAWVCSAKCRVAVEATDEYGGNICFSCARCYGGCPWTERDKHGRVKFEPVPGWTAKKRRRSKAWRSKEDGYHIIDCPLYEPDEERLIGRAEIGDVPVRYRRQIFGDSWS